ncbi:hypothetical protein DL96DRAFT_1820311 [Flagelloscypha sp. PMI_526]|nr:hypothetical protein DL96DRAFT_1820311 [Flagelloscypha sp. PMI_526]
MSSSWSTDQVWSIIKAYEETCRALQEIQSEISFLQKRASQLESQRSSQHAMLVKLSEPAKERAFNTFDVLQQIFAYAIETEKNKASDDFIHVQSLHQDFPTVFAVSSVSSLWRNTALRSPKLWQRIGFSGFRDLQSKHKGRAFHRVECCLRSSFPLPLMIRWEDLPIRPRDTGPCSWAKSLFEIIALHSYRWKTAKLRLSLAQYQSIFPLNMPKLETLVFGNVGMTRVDLVLGFMPSLRTLKLMDDGTYDHGLPWDQLTTISALGCGTAVDSLKNCEHLERLYLVPGRFAFAFRVLTPISLPYLQHLSIHSEWADIPWSNLTMPALESLTMGYEYWLPPESDEFRQFLERCSRLRLIQIHLLAIESNPNSLEVEPLFDLFSSSTACTLQLSLPRSCHNLQPLLPFLTVHHLKKQFPTLCHIHIGMMDLETSHSSSACNEDAVAHAIFSLSNEIEQYQSVSTAQSSLQMIHFHTSPSHKDQLSPIYPTSSHLRVTSTPMIFDWRGEFHFVR